VSTPLKDLSNLHAERYTGGSLFFYVHPKFTVGVSMLDASIAAPRSCPECSARLVVICPAIQPDDGTRLAGFLCPSCGFRL